MKSTINVRTHVQDIKNDVQPTHTLKFLRIPTTGREHVLHTKSTLFLLSFYSAQLYCHC